MALGDGGNNSGKRYYDSTYYSRMRFADPINKNLLGFSYRSGMVIMNISKAKDSSVFEYDTLDEIYITPTKAYLLIEDYKKLCNESEFDFGVISGLKETVSACVFGRHDGKDTITIGKINGDGKWVSSTVFNCNAGDYHYSINWENVDKNKFSKIPHDNLEFMMIMNLFENFANGMSGAVAYSVADLMRFDMSRCTGRLKPIYEKLGLEWGGNSNRNSGDGNNYFSNNTRGGSSEHKDYDEAMEELPFN